jgi:Rps23 Pro-64 3,4-dihydroxylase Tpa1-like proline 4-hydroxylase
MKLIQNVLSEETIQKITDRVNSTMDQNSWSVSSLWWPMGIRVGNHVGVITQLLKDELRDEIESQITGLLPPYNEICVQIYLWPEGSNISWHDDGSDQKLAAATIYLNIDWHPDFGGLFVWEDADTKEMRVLCPKYNSMVINDRREMHLVTPVTSAAPLPRLSLQIWGF